jgi:hypothetical protein
MKLAILFVIALFSCAQAQSGFLFGNVQDLTTSSGGGSCAVPLSLLFGSGCDANGLNCQLPAHGVGITITTSNSRTKETTFLRGCLQLDTFDDGIALTNVARPGFWGVASSEKLRCCGGRAQPFDVGQSDFSINYIEIDPRGNVFVRGVEGDTLNFTLSCLSCGSFPGIAFVGELTIVFQFTVFPGGINECPDVPINQPCSNGSCDCSGGSTGSVSTGGSATGSVSTGDGSVVGDGGNVGGDGGDIISDGSFEGTTGDGSVADQSSGSSAASSLRPFYLF